MGHMGWYGVVMRRGFLLLPLVTVWCLAQTPVETARSYRQAHEVEILRDFVELLRIPNVATDSERRRAGPPGDAGRRPG